MPHSSEIRRLRGDRPVIGMLFGFHMFGTGRVYDFVDAVTRGIQAGARDYGFDLLAGCGVSQLNPELLRPAWPVPAPDVDFVPVGPWNTDGLIVVHPLCSQQRSDYIRELKASGFPVVFVGAAEGGPAIDLDNAGGIRQAAAHLVQHGHRRIAFIGGIPEHLSGDSPDRLRAFREAIREHGLASDPALIAYGYHHVVGGRQAMQSILASGVLFTAVMASNDESALGAMQVLAEAGLDVPHDVAVIGFDNRPDGAYELPALTTVHHPVFERGYLAVNLMADFLNARRARDDVVIQTSTRLFVRHSCGCVLQDIIARHTVPAASNATDAAPIAVHQTRLTQVLTEAILGKTLQSEPAEVYEQAAQLMEAFVASLMGGNDVAFISTLHAVLARAEQIESDAGVWEFAIRALEESPESRALGDTVASGPAAHDAMLSLYRRAHSVIADMRQRQNWRNRHLVSEVNGFLTATLFSSRDETEILAVLAEHAPKIGIRRSAIVLFEAEGSDPAAWSSMRTSADPQAVPIRFPSRAFPMKDFSSGQDPVRLAFVPIVIDEGKAGYMVIDADNLALCSNVVLAVNTALRTSRMYRSVVETNRMYRDAVEHRRVAEEASSLKSRFLSAVSHELRTPLSLILTASELLEKDKRKPDGAYTRNLAHIRAGAEHLNGLVRDVMDLTRNEMGQLRLTYEPVDLASTLESVAAVGEQLARAKGLKWRAEIPETLPNVWADRARLRQIVLNLLTNAVKFTAQGEVALRVESVERKVVVAVQDSGVGVPEGEHEAIFNEFQQSTRTAGHDDGLGLGLAICKRLVEMHGGEIGVLSSGKTDAGSTFFFSMPVLKMGIDGIVQSLYRDQPLFLMDDEVHDVDALLGQLAHRGFEARRLRVSDLSDLFATRSWMNPSGVVLVGVDVPPEHSQQVIKRLKDNAMTRDLSVLFYSLSANTVGAAPLQLDYLTKPIGSVDLMRTLERQGGTIDATARTVLVVEDDPGLLEMHAQIVQTLSSSHRVLKAGNGREAIALIRNERPDLVLLDLVMPELDGFDVLDAMQEHETTRNIPVIVMSGQTLTDEEMTRLNRGVMAVLTKGVFTAEETQAQIQQTLNNTHGFSGEARHVVRKAMAYIHEHFREPLARGQIARHLHISENHLTRCFRQVLHVPPMTYVTRYRVTRAKDLLSTDSMPVARIAAVVGFPNEFYFSYVFRRETGMTPSAYRKSQHAPQ